LKTSYTSFSRYSFSVHVNLHPVSSRLKRSRKKAEKKSRLNDANDNDYIVSEENKTYLILQLINTASANLGAHYRPGGTSSEGF
jgi:hypothetical protein